jgi:hypothetical protein
MRPRDKADFEKLMNTRLQGTWLVVARVAWLVLVLVAIVMLVAGTIEKSREPFALDCSQPDVCNPIELSSADLALVADLGLDSPAFASLWTALNLVWNLSYVVMAGLIFWHRSDDWIALLVSAVLALLGAVSFSPANSILDGAHPGWARVVEAWEVAAYVSLLLLLLIFPDGRFVPRWTRFALPLLLVFFLDMLSASDLVQIMLLPFIVYAGIAVYAQIYRHRGVSNPLQRQQTKWVALGLLSTVLLMGLWLVVAITLPPERPSLARTYAVLAVTPVLWTVGLVFPASIGIAVLRYRLWDVDVIIRRTLLYAALTATLLFVYFGAVVLLQGLFVAVGNQRSSVAIVISTLAIAALFNPLRRRIQATIDRRFYRRKYDAAQTLAAFAAAARDETDLDALTGRLLDVVSETIQPEHASLWLRE